MSGLYVGACPGAVPGHPQDPRPLSHQSLAGEGMSQAPLDPQLALRRERNPDVQRASRPDHAPAWCVHRYSAWPGPVAPCTPPLPCPTHALYALQHCRALPVASTQICRRVDAGTFSFLHWSLPCSCPDFLETLGSKGALSAPPSPPRLPNLLAWRWL